MHDKGLGKTLIREALEIGKACAACASSEQFDSSLADLPRDDDFFYYSTASSDDESYETDPEVPDKLVDLEKESESRSEMLGIQDPCELDVLHVPSSSNSYVLEARNTYYEFPEILLREKEPFEHSVADDHIFSSALPEPAVTANEAIWCYDLPDQSVPADLGTDNFDISNLAGVLKVADDLSGFLSEENVFVDMNHLYFYHTVPSFLSSTLEQENI